jgi:hypothetical protein
MLTLTVRAPSVPIAKHRTLFRGKAMCSDGTSAMRVGDMTPFDDDGIASELGGAACFEDGLTENDIGDCTFYRDGTTTIEMGGTTFFYDRSSCTRKAKRLSCY